ncbi:substrate-binding domain-containing protein [Arthrobacter sp. FW306-2-2C-D06B]|uniref:substrate-binding domain-containing protein n=1 Tax=Arthrobacter sp. FW306-2-2C-D06B TaxID=2879618 RepID=UPI001F237828|nr:substrate-binding domain-containing protein [Arthrobacter sp. FW306-2-2C-D06B]UKA59456.1 substrate-binding domain-containing protein [Arthrobacter sp. FW306-2-2C-D06B]
MSTAPTVRRFGLRAAVGALAITLALAGCSGGGGGTAASSGPAAKPSLEFAGPNGEKPGALSELSLTSDEQAKVKGGKYTAAFVWHTSSDFVTAVEKGAREEFKNLGIDVVASTQANFNAATQANNVQTVLALHPNIIVTIAVDPTSAAEAFKPAVAAGTKLVIMTTPPAGYQAGKDFVSIVTENLAQAGRANAEILGDALGKTGEVGYISYNANFWFTNQRDKSFKDWLAYEYPDMKIVDSEGFADETATQTIAAAMIAKNPNIKGIYVSWATAAQGVVAAIKAAGRNDIQVVTNDLDTTLAASMASGTNVAGMVGNGSLGIGKGLALAGAYGVLGKTAPALVASDPTKVTKADLDKGWLSDYGTQPPSSITGG